MPPALRPPALVAVVLMMAGAGVVPASAQAVVGAVRHGAEPVAGALVRLLDADFRPLAGMRSDAEGRFRLSPSGAGRYYVVVEAPGFATALSDPLPVPATGLLDHPVELVTVGPGGGEPTAVVEAADLARACGVAEGARGGIVVGQVRDPAGETLRGVWVSAEWTRSGLPVRHEIRSGVDGLFVFCAVPAGPEVTLRAAATDRVGPAARVRVHEAAVHRFDLSLPETASDRPGRVLGRVVDVGTGVGIASAELTVQGTGLRLWTDVNGHFALDSVPPGLHSLRVDHLAYAARELGLVVTPDGTHGVNVPMAHEAIELEPVVVTVRSSRWFGDMRAFQRRMLTAAGAFFTRQDIARLQPTRLVDLLREVPGVDVQLRRNGPPVIRMRGRVCEPDLVVDRVRQGDRRLLTELRGVDMEALEVYRSAVESPGEFTRPGTCGAILVWTRRAVV